MGSYLRFEAFKLPKTKTDSWNLWSTQGNHLLGVIKWKTSWRRYAFFPEAGTLFERDCLRHIADHLETETRRVLGISAANKKLTRTEKAG